MAGMVAAAWNSLPGYNEQDVDPFLAAVLPVVSAGQRQSVALTNAYLAQFLRRPPLPLEVGTLTGAALRNGTPPEQVYRRPFVKVWTSLKNVGVYDQAVAAGLEYATSTAEMDVQMASRAAYQAVQDADDNIYGYQRAADGGACQFCVEVDGAYVKSADAMPLHNRCGCGLEPLTAPHPRAASLPSGVAVHEHGELGPVLTDPAHQFTTPADF